MNAHTPTSKPPLPRRVRKVSDEILRLVKRPVGASIEEVSALSGMKEQTARSRISKLKAKGYSIVRDPQTQRFHLVAPQRIGQRVAPDPVEPDDFEVGQSNDLEDDLAEPGQSSEAQPMVVPGLGRLLQIMRDHRDLQVISYQGGVIFLWKDNGSEKLERVDIDLPTAIEALGLAA